MPEYAIGIDFNLKWYYVSEDKITIAKFKEFRDAEMFVDFKRRIAMANLNVVKEVVGQE